MNHDHTQSPLHESSTSTGGEKMYTCPMHPEVHRNKPGMCPECGMNLIEVKGRKLKVERGGGDKIHNKHAGHSTTLFFRKFWISLILTIPVVLYADIIKKIFGWNPPSFPGSEYLPLVFSSIVFFYGGRVFLAGARRELSARLPGMM